MIAFEKINDTLTTLSAKRPPLADFLRALKRHPQCNQRDLVTFLVMPVQHIPKMQLLVEELIRKTPEDHPDRYAQNGRYLRH